MQTSSVLIDRYKPTRYQGEKGFLFPGGGVVILATDDGARERLLSAYSTRDALVVAQRLLAQPAHAKGAHFVYLISRDVRSERDAIVDQFSACVGDELERID